MLLCYLDVQIYQYYFDIYSTMTYQKLNTRLITHYKLVRVLPTHEQHITSDIYYNSGAQ